MIKIPISVAHWADNVNAGGLYGKSLSADADKGVAMWYLGHGVLVEQRGKPDRLVPISNVLTVEAGAKLTPEQWGGEDGAKKEVAPPGLSAWLPEQARPVEATTAGISANTAPLAPVVRRGPGRPPKA